MHPIIRSLRFPILTVLLLSAPFMASAQDGGQRATVLSPQEPRTLLPHFDLLTLTHEVLHLAFDCLLVIGPDGEYLPRLLSEVPTLENGGISEDGRVYTLRLRDDVTWHDGEPFTSEDVRFTWQTITDPDLPVPSRAVWEDIEAIETPDPHTAIVRFAEPNVGFLAAAATDSCFVLPQHALGGTDLVDSEAHRRPVGTGPFIIQEWVSGSHLRATANPDYWGGAPELDEVVVRFVGGSEGLRTALQRGEAELALHLTSADVRFVDSLEAYAIEQAPDHAWWQFWINNEDEVLSDPRVRQALAYGLDKSEITETVMAGLVEPQAAVLPESHWAHEPDLEGYPFDPERAAQLLQEAGWTLGDNGIRSRDGQPLTLEILNIAGQTERRQVVQIVQDQWRELGIDASIREIDAAAFPPTMSEGNYQLAYGWFGETEEPTFNLWLGTNWQNYDNEEAFDLLRQVPSTIDRQERGELIRRFQRIVAEDVAILPLAPRPVLNAVHQRLDGYRPSLTGSLWNIEEWSQR